MDFRVLQACDRCAEHEMCPIIRHEVRAVVESLSWLATITHREMPPGEIVLDCRGFRRAPQNKNFGLGSDKE